MRNSRKAYLGLSACIADYILNQGKIAAMGTLIIVHFLLFLALGLSDYYDIPAYYGHFSLNYFQASQLLTRKLTLLEYHFAADASYDNKTLFFAQEGEHCVYSYSQDKGEIAKLAGSCGTAGNTIGSIVNTQFNGVSSVAYFRAPSQQLLSEISNQTITIVANQTCSLNDTDCLLSLPYANLTMKNIRITPQPSLYSVQSNQSEFLYLADTNNHCIKRMSLDTLQVEVVAGFCSKAGFLDGPLGYNRLNFPRNLGVSREGVVFFFDSGNQYIRIIKTDGTVSTLLLGACKEYRNGRSFYGYELKQILCYEDWLETTTEGSIDHNFDPGILQICTAQFSQCS